ncbi:hypothetical protein F5887DRAFT_1011185 [Amanita rubescens]|nr:hypothetical protein F5887DRAFT_1011185 [Amanita rubescens]
MAARSAKWTSAGPLSSFIMAEDFNATRRYFSSLRTGFKLVKTYVREFRYDSATSQSANLPDNAQTLKRPALTESVCLFPGWAVRRYVDDGRKEFDLHVHVSGYATSLRSPPTRAQVTFMRLAKSIAALNKFAETHYPKSTPVSDPDSPESKEKEHDSIEELDESYQLAIDGNDSLFDDDVLQSPSEPTIRGDVSDLLQRLQDNLDSRVKLFWPSMLSSRVVNLELFASQHGPPVGRSEVNTGTDGTFRHHFVIKWDDICDHPLAQCEQVTDYELILHAKLLPPSLASLNPEESKVEKQTIFLNHAHTRVISDIDDTIKMSNILGGAAHNLQEQEAVIPGMGEWYYNMWNQGVRFHYVSNGPNQLLPLVLQFLKVAQLPPGSIKLKSYAPRSLFRELLKAPADRKRDNLVQILDSFEDSKFILVGDSGEQDLELYAQLASLHPEKILGIFIRDVEPDLPPIRDPTGEEWEIRPPSRSNTSSSYGNGVAPGMSRSNSLFGKFSRGRNWLTSTPSPAFSSIPLLEDDQPPSSDEYEPMILCNAQPIKKIDLTEPTEEQTWLSSSPPKLSSSPLSFSPLDQAGDGAPSQQPSLAIRINSRSRGSCSNGTEASFSDINEDPASFANRRSPAIAFADKMSISQSPERANVLKSNMSARSGASPNPNLRASPKRRRTHTTDGISVSAPPPSRPSLRPQRRNSANPSPSLSGAGADSPLTSSSLLSLSRYRNMSEGERKRAELQNRVWSARASVPGHVVLRIFKDPSECVEVEELLKKRPVS